MDWPSDWLLPDWPAPAHVHAVFTTRAGGHSVAPYDSMNLGDHVGDVLDHVQRNRQVLAQALAARPVFLQQVHGRVVARLQALGVSGIYGNDGSPDWCTVSNPSRFFSYRRDGVCGRMAACIWLGR